MTETEKQQIISLVLQALKTNSLTIEQLTDTTELSKDMYVEVSGGRKISIDLLSSTIAKMVNGDFDALVENVNKIAKDLSDGDAELLKRITGVSDKSNPLTDPFKSIGSFTTIGSFKDKLKTMYSGDSSIGNYRCILSVDSSKIPVNIQIERLELNKVCQSFTSCIQLATMSDNAEGVYLGTVCTISRIGIVSNESVTWGKWTSVINDFEERIGKANGIAPLNEESKVPSECLPEPLSLGESEDEAFPGDRGKALEDAMTNIPSDIIKPDSFSVLSDASYLNVSFKKVSKTTGKETDDSFRLPSATLEQAGLLSAEDKQALEDMKSGTPADDVTHPIVIVDEIRPLKDGYYTLETAIAAIVSYQQESGVKYERTGLIITYKTGEYEMETRQFQGAVSDFATPSLWKPFGNGGGSSVFETSDEPAEGGKDAFSTGGAYAYVPANLDVNVETEGIVKLQMKNAAGETLGDEVQFAIGTGGGGQTGGTIVAIAFQSTPVYGSYGSTLRTFAAIRSVTSNGVESSDNLIEKLELVDRESGLTVWTETVNKASSGDMKDFSFELDFTAYFTAAGTRKFKLIATDESGNTGSKNVNVTAVDITCTCVQVLNYTPETLLTPTTESFSLPLYKFGNNTSDKGISAQVDIKINGEWQSLSTTVVNDNYSHSVVIRPASLGLEHGTYPLRIQGMDVASGVKGNVIYTAVMVIDPNSSTPLVPLRYDDKNGGVVRLYETVELDVACYDPLEMTSPVSVKANNVQVTQIAASRNKTYQVKQQLQGYKADGTDTVNYTAVCKDVTSEPVRVTVSGSAIDAAIKEGAIYNFDFSSRTNQETDHSIVSGNYEMKVDGANWTTNGFGTFLGENCLRVAENVGVSLNHAPFAGSSIESNGAAIQFAFASKNVTDDDALLLSCYDETSGAGFYVTGRVVGIFCNNGVSRREERAYRQGEKITVAVVVEPASNYVERDGTRYSMMKLFLNGEEVACLGYVPGGGSLIQTKYITMDGRLGDLYLYYMMAWNSYMEWAQAFKNYLVRLTDTEVMVKEYAFEDVLKSQTAEGSTQSRPSAAEIYSRGMPYIVECPYEGSDIEALDGTTSTSTKIYITLYYFDPERPWRNFKAMSVQTRNQGTTSAKRPVKNKRYYLAKSKGKNKDTRIILLNPDDTTEEGRRAIALAAINKVQVGDNTIPVDVITVKVDYSDSGNANDCGACEMMNVTYRALGGNYMTPVQRAFDGTFDSGDLHIEDLQMNHSTANHPVATYRCKDDSLQNVYFHAKGNWKEDKGEQFALGFKDTPGYNKGCLNYGDFIEFFGTPDETLDAIEIRFKQTDGLDTDSVYLLSLYCGSSYRIMRYQDGSWKKQSGSMKYENGKWNVTGDVLNPVEGFELLNYQGMDWFQGVGSVQDMMAMKTDKSSWVQKLVDNGTISADTFPAWTYYFESLVDDDQLAIDYALGKKVPYNLYRWLRFCDSCDYSKGGNWQRTWKENLYKYACPESVLSYDIFTDYLAATDQRAKNMQPMWFLEEYASVTDGVYSSEDAMRMYLNKIYDCDTLNSKDNDGGCTVDAEVDPNRTSDETFTNPYAGYGSVLFNNIYLQQVVWTDSSGTELSLRTVAAAMRNVQATIDGVTLHPFSPEGATHFFIDKRLKKWQKLVSSYDGERKYISYTATSDAIYFYALQGLGLTALPSFIERRWRIRDGYFQTGDFFSGVISGRVSSKSNATIRIVAAKNGYFGVGNDASGNLSESCFLEAGEEYVFTNFSHEEGALLYIYQADRMKLLDLSEISLSSTVSFSAMQLVETLILGSDTHTEQSIGSYAPLTSLNCGEMPFLVSLDIRNTQIATLVTDKCPRIAHINASGSKLENITLAETSPINDISLPATMTSLRFVGLPELTYTGLSAPSGLQIESMPNVQRLRLETSPQLDAIQMLRDVLASQAASRKLSMLRISNMTLKADGSELLAILEYGVAGMDEDGNRQDKPVVNGTYELTVIRETDEIESLESGIDGLVILTVIDAYIDLINWFNNESYGGEPYYDNVTLDNINEVLEYYNGETYEEYLERFAEDNMDINDLINK